MRRTILGIALFLLGCSDAATESAQQESSEGGSGGTGVAADQPGSNDTPTGITPTVPAPSVPAASGGQMGSGGGMTASGGAPSGSGGQQSGSGGQQDEGLELVGDAPQSVQLAATNVNFEKLPDTDEYTSFAGEEPFFIAPLDAENFPPGFDHCNAPGGDPELNEKQQWARARLKTDLKTWYYDVTLLSVPEEDGLTPYQLVIDGEVVREFTTPATGTMGAEDRKDYPHVWENVPIEAGQTVEVWAKAHSNLEIPENDPCRTYEKTHAWARGRFSGLILEAAE